MNLSAVAFPFCDPLFGAATVTQFQGFRFFTTFWTLTVSLALVALTACICLVAWRRSGYALLQGLLELLRFGIVALVAVLLNQPEWVQEYKPTDKPTIAVLHDASPSMDTRDVVLTGTAPGAGVPTTRREAAAPLTAGEFWKPLEDRFKVGWPSSPPSMPRRATTAHRSAARSSGSANCRRSCWSATATGTRGMPRAMPPSGCGWRTSRC
jgi:hypothetical protein